jgi:hypothetical protein
MSWWKEDKAGNKKFITIYSFNFRIFLIALLIGIIGLLIKLFAS